MNEIISDSNVAVIGNAQSLFNKSYGELIDSYDIVIRINLGNDIHHLPKESHGSKHTIAAYSNTNLRIFQNSLSRIVGLKIPIWHCSERGRGARWAGLTNLFLPIYEKDDLARPSCGFLILHYLLNRLHLSQVSIFGFDFKETPTFYHKSRIYEPHNYEIERNKICSDKRIQRFV